jgi:hypothetical protein
MKEVMDNFRQAPLEKHCIVTFSQGETLLEQAAMRTRPNSAHSVTGDAVENEGCFLPRGQSLPSHLRGKDNLPSSVR